MKLNIFGITKAIDSAADEYVYNIGENGQFPIALMLLMESGFTNSINRYFNLFTHSENADKQANIFLKQKINLTSFVDKFNKKELTINQPIFLKKWTPIVLDLTLLSEAEPYDNSKINLYQYAEKFAIFIAMKTCLYHSKHEGLPMACSMSYINYEGRPEFTNVYQGIDNALESIILEVTKLMKEKQIEFNEYNLTINLDDYKSFTFREYYGF
jgi:hypothetical protein